MSFLQTCYGADIEALADLAGPSWMYSAASLADFTARQWTQVAGALGFLGPLRQALGGVTGPGERSGPVAASRPARGPGAAARRTCSAAISATW